MVAVDNASATVMHQDAVTMNANEGSADFQWSGHTWEGDTIEV